MRFTFGECGDSFQPMWLVWIFLAIAVSIALLIVVDLRWPSSTAVKSGKDWQGLIGALLGFLVLGVSISLSEIVQSDKTEQDELESELAYLEMVESEQQEFQRLLEKRLAQINEESSDRASAKCFAVEKTLRGFQVRSSLLETQLPNLVPVLHPESVRAITLANSGQQHYSDGLGTILQDQAGCPSRPADHLALFEGLHQASLEHVNDVLKRLADQKAAVSAQINP